MRRTGSVTMLLTTVRRMPPRSTSWRAATMPRMVAMHVPSAVATRSVGEKDSPLPWLSRGASVCRVVPEGVCVARQRSSPS